MAQFTRPFKRDAQTEKQILGYLLTEFRIAICPEDLTDRDFENMRGLYKLSVGGTQESTSCQQLYALAQQVKNLVELDGGADPTMAATYDIAA